MLFPDSPRVAYENHPLVLVQVICQLKFPTILEIGSADPADFQNRVRKQYPIYSRQEQLSPIASRIPKEFGDLIGSLGLATGRPGPHRFAKEDETRSISLAQEYVAISEEGYTRWEDLRAEIDQMVQALVGAYEPPFLSRVGLRYRDEIEKESLGLADEPWQNLIKPELLGLLGVDFLEGSVLESQSNTLCAIKELGAGAMMRINQGLASNSEQKQVYRIDADLFVDRREEIKDVIPLLDQLHRTGGNFFRWAITSRLAEALKPQPI